MKKHKVLMNKRLMRNTTTVTAMLISVFLMFSSAVSMAIPEISSTQENITTGETITAPISAETDIPLPPNIENETCLLYEEEKPWPGSYRGVIVWDNGLDHIGLYRGEVGSGVTSTIADDFKFGSDICIQDVHWIGGYWAGTAQTPWCVEFFKDSGGVPGASHAGPFCWDWDEMEKIPVGSYYEFHADLPEDVCFDGGSTYWITIYAEGSSSAPYAGPGMHWWVNPGTSQAMWKWPEYGYPNWVPCTTVIGYYPADMCFQLTIKPEHDAGVTEIVSPNDDSTMCPCIDVEVKVKNFGLNDEEDVDVTVQIRRDIWEDTFDPWEMIWDNGCPGCTWSLTWYDSGTPTGPPSARTGSYMAELNSGTGGANGACKMWEMAYEDLSDTCHPMMSFYMWHDGYGSDDYIEVAVDGGDGFFDDIVGGPFYRNDGTSGWQEHVVDMSSYAGEGAVRIAFIGNCDSNPGAYNLHIDDVAKWDLEYEQTKQVDIDVGEEVEVEFTQWCPCLWQIAEDETYDFEVVAWTDLDCDENPANDELRSYFSLYFNCFHDVGVTEIKDLESGPAQQEYEMCVDVTNFGQYDECCFKVHMTVGELGPETSYCTTMNSGMDDGYYYTVPTSWSQSSYATWYWYPYSNYMTGYAIAPPNARLSYYRAYDGCWLMTDPIDTSANDVLLLEFANFIDHWTGSGYYSLFVEVTPDGSTWTDITPWTNPLSGNVGPEILTLDATAAIGTNSQVRFRGQEDIDFYYMDYWFVDDVCFKGHTALAPEYEEEYCIDCIEICETQEVCMDDWVPDALSEPPICDSIKYAVKAWTDMCDPPDCDNDNDAISKLIEIDYWSDVELVELVSPAQYRVPWDLEFVVGVPQSLYVAGVGADDTYVYVPEWSGSNIFKFQLSDGSYIGSFTVGVSNLRDLAYDGQYFYGGSSGYTIYEMDFNAQTLVSTISSSVSVRAIAYDHANDNFYVSNWGDPVGIINRDGSTAGTFNLGSTTSTYGFAYDDYCPDGPFLWVHDQTGTPSYSVIHQWDLDTSMFTGFIKDVLPDVPGGSSAGGLCITEGYEAGMSTIVAMCQGSPDTFVGYELCPAGPVLPTPQIWIACGEWEISALIRNNGVYDEGPMSAFAELYMFGWEAPYPRTLVWSGQVDDIYLDAGEEDTIVFDTFEFEEPGVYELNISIPLGHDCIDNNDGTWIIGVDCCEPESEHTLDPATPDGLNNWYVSDVEVCITALDRLCPDCIGISAGVDEIRYTINGEMQDPIEGPSGCFVIDEDGNILVEYWAVDNVGNEEEKHTFSITIDRGDPTCDMSWEAYEEGDTWMVDFEVFASDSISGLNRVEFYIDGSLEDTMTVGPFIFTIEWDPDEYDSSTTFKATAHDNAGNSASSTVDGVTSKSNAQPHSQPQIVPKALVKAFGA
jgi:hypothetical protein